MDHQIWCICIPFIGLTFLCFSSGAPEVIFAVNCGGPEHIDVNGVHYQADFNRIGTPSDYGKALNIQRVPLQDAILYQTERYHVDTFSYSIPVEDDGDYVLVLKFSEVWFAARSEKVLCDCDKYECRC